MLLEVVADKTGYPPEMLSLEMELEGDLGIDSIKRVEILSAMNERVPDLPEVDTAVMAKLSTLALVVEYMDERLSAAPPVAESVATAAVDLQALLLEVVADKTGYPPEMLSLEMELEGDLGIDSIKRVEILSAMNERVPDLPEVDTAVMARLSTLALVVDYMNERLSGDAEPTAAVPAATEPEALRPVSSLGRFVLEPLEQRGWGFALHGLYGSGDVAVVDGDSGLAEPVVAALRSRGVDARAVFGLPESKVRGVVFLGGLREVADDADSTQINREAFEVARAVAGDFEARETGSGVFVTVQDTGGAFGTCDFDPKRAWLAGCAALCRTVAREWPGISVKAVDLERGGRGAEQLAVALVDELTTGGPDVDVGLGASGRRVVLRQRAVEAASGPLALDDGDVVVASGGGRGITAATLIGLAACAKLRFVLLGRTALEDEPASCRGLVEDAALKRALLTEAQAGGQKPTPADLARSLGRVVANREIRSTLSAIEEAGSEARYLPVDVTDTTAVTGSLDEVRASWAPVAAVVHGAGVLADRRVSEKTPEQFDRVFDTKVEGLRALVAATDSDPLKMICVYSSVAAAFGNSGQADYAMANEVLNKVAVAESRRRGDACLVRSLAWGPWEGGMVTPSLKAHFEQMGVALIPLAVGAQMLVDEVVAGSSGAVEVLLGGTLGNGSGEVRSFSVDVAVGRRSHPYLEDHSIRGVPVVPAALVIEWFSRAAKAFDSSLVLERLSDLEVVRGVALENFGDGDELLALHCRQLASGQGATLALELNDAAGALCYRCTADLAAQRTPPRTVEEGNEDELALEAWGEGSVYDGELLFHGPAFQMIRGVSGISEAGAVAELSGLEEGGDPLTLDGGLQLALLWCRRVLGGASLPTSIKEVRSWLDAPSAPPVRCALRGRSAQGLRSVSDLVFSDASGNLLAELLGVETHLLPVLDADPKRA